MMTFVATVSRELALVNEPILRNLPMAIVWLFLDHVAEAGRDLDCRKQSPSTYNNHVRTNELMWEERKRNRREAEKSRGSDQWIPSLAEPIRGRQFASDAPASMV